MTARKTNEQFVAQMAQKFPDIIPLDEYVSNHTKIHFKCLKDGCVFEATPGNLLSPKCRIGCPVCNKQQCIAGINDAATKRPDLLKYFVNKDEAVGLAMFSKKKVLLECPECHNRREMYVVNLVRRGFSCPTCTDTISYPNKFARAMFSQLDVDVIYEYMPRWENSKYHYDNYFELNGGRYICQMDGGFHYLNNELGETNRKHDAEKNRSAKENGVTMIRIDCRESDKDYIRKNVEKSLLAELFDLGKVDWDLCDMKATKNLAKEVCLYYEQHYKEFTKEEIAQKFHISMTPMDAYFKKGLKFGWCKRHPAIHKSKRRLNPDFEKEVCEYYESHYLKEKKQDIAKHFRLAYKLFEQCINDGLRNGWCRDCRPLGQKIRQDRNESDIKMVCDYYEKYHDKFSQKEMWEHFGISQPTFRFCLSKGYENGWCNKHPRFHK